MWSVNRSNKNCGFRHPGQNRSLRVVEDLDRGLHCTNTRGILQKIYLLRHLGTYDRYRDAPVIKVLGEYSP